MLRWDAVSGLTFPSINTFTMMGLHTVLLALFLPYLIPIMTNHLKTTITLKQSSYRSKGDVIFIYISLCL